MTYREEALKSAEELGALLAVQGVRGLNLLNRVNYRQAASRCDTRLEATKRIGRLLKEKL